MRTFDTMLPDGSSVLCSLGFFFFFFFRSENEKATDSFLFFVFKSLNGLFGLSDSIKTRFRNFRSKEKRTLLLSLSHCSSARELDLLRDKLGRSALLERLCDKDVPQSKHDGHQKRYEQQHRTPTGRPQLRPRQPRVVWIRIRDKRHIAKGRLHGTTDETTLL
jgi:hypothetical protein